MDEDDIADLVTHWRKTPPAHVALRRVEEVLVAAHGLVREERSPASSGPPPEPPSPEDLRRMLDAFNARFSGRVARA